jgi:xylulokinase
MSLAVIEGVSFALNNCLDLIRQKGIEINEVTLCGGGTRSKIWPHMIANILNVKVNFMQTEQGPGYGGAILAMVACNKFKDCDAAISALVKKKSFILPDANVVERYKAKYQKYLNIYPNIKNI